MQNTMDARYALGYEDSTRPLTSGRYCVAPPAAFAARGHGAAIGYFDTLPAACEYAHASASTLHPLAVFDGESRPLNQRVHLTGSA